MSLGIVTFGTSGTQHFFAAATLMHLQYVQLSCATYPEPTQFTGLGKGKKVRITCKRRANL